MPASERDKMAAGEWYCCLDDELDLLRRQARIAVHAHNTLPPDERGAVAPALRELFAQVALNVVIEAPFHCSYGINITLGERVYFNAGCTILDSGRVTVGDRSMPWRICTGQPVSMMPSSTRFFRPSSISARV